MTINDCVNDKKNNYDIIRFFAAVFVIFSHAYPLTSHGGEFFVTLSNGQSDLGSMAVAIFFIISGFLITQSFDRTENLRIFIKSRILRIYPGLIAAVFLCVFVIGPNATTLRINEYLTNGDTYNYLKVIYLFPMQWTLPGVFENSSFNNSVNGSLWTIPFEILSYGIVALIGFIGLLKHKKVVLLLCIVSLYAKAHMKIFVPENITWIYLPSFLDLFSFFAIGMFVYSYKDKIILSKWYALISLLMLFISLRFGGFVDVFTICGSYLIFYVVYNKKIKLHNFNKYGDFSFGIYVYAFPIQQTVTYLFGGEISVIMNIMISLPTTIIIAYFSWHVVEKPALMLKNKSIISKYFKKHEYRTTKGEI